MLSIYFLRHLESYPAYIIVQIGLLLSNMMIGFCQPCDNATLIYKLHRLLIAFNIYTILFMLIIYVINDVGYMMVIPDRGPHGGRSLVQRIVSAYDNTLLANWRNRLSWQAWTGTIGNVLCSDLISIYLLSRYSKYTCGVELYRVWAVVTIATFIPSLVYGFVYTCNWLLDRFRRHGGDENRALLDANDIESNGG